MKDLKKKLIAIDNGKFEKIIKSLTVKPICGECYYFMPTIQDPGHGYRCKISGTCIADTLDKRLLSYLWWKLELITKDEHLTNIS